MKIVFIAFFLLFLVPTEVYVYEFKDNRTPKLATLNCQKITAYYNGTFERPTDRSQRFDAEFQFMADINLKDKIVYFNFGNFNRNYSESYQFIMILSNWSWVVCNTTQTKPCYIKSGNNIPSFGVGFFPGSDYEYAPDMVHVYPLKNKRFTLLNPVGNCATTLKNNALEYADPSLFKNCFCCGEKYNPDPSLNCPISPWK